MGLIEILQLTTDSLELTVTLLGDFSLTFVATIRGNICAVLRNYLADPDREVHSSLFCYNEKSDPCLVCTEET